MNNARQIGLALFEFENAYGQYPDATSVTQVRDTTGTSLSLATTTSNDFFRQLVAAEIAQSEAMFYADISGVHRPDNIFNATHALEKGECGFSYLVGAKSTDNPRRPIVVTPLIPGTDRFDPKPFNGEALVFGLEASLHTYKIDKDGHVFIDGRNLMDPHHPIWDGHAPVIAWPDL